MRSSFGDRTFAAVRTTSLEQSTAQFQTLCAVIRPVQVVTGDIKFGQRGYYIVWTVFNCAEWKHSYLLTERQNDRKNDKPIWLHNLRLGEGNEKGEVFWNIRTLINRRRSQGTKLSHRRLHNVYSDSQKSTLYSIRITVSIFSNSQQVTWTTSIQLFDHSIYQFKHGTVISKIHWTWDKTIS